MIHFHHGAGRAQRRVVGQFLHRQDWATGNVELIENVHRLELGLGHGPLFDAAEDLVQPRQAHSGIGVVRIGFPRRLADHVANRLPHRRLRDEIDVGVGIFLPALALQDPSRLAATRVIARARHRIAERNTVAKLAVFLEWTVPEPLLIAQLDAAEVQHAVLHGAGHLLALAGRRSLEQRRDNAKCEMQAGAAIADLCAGDQWQAVAKTCR